MTAPTTLRNRIYPSIADVVGNTALIDITRFGSGGAEVLLKMECDNPLNSVKDRIGKAMIEAAEADGRIGPGTHIIEPTSGNTGIALAFICAAKRYKLTLCMPETMSLERRAVLRHLGANLVLTPGELGMRGAVARATEMYEAERATSRVFMPQQFDNPANPKAHEATTGPEIWNDCGGNIDAIVAGVGTGGTITGVTRFIRKHNPAFQAIAVEPQDSAVISGGKPGPHKIQGVGAGFIPRNLDTSLINEVLTVSNDEAIETARRLARQTGIMGGISTGANVACAMRVAARSEYKGKRIVTICCSFAERYLSTMLFAQETG